MNKAKEPRFELDAEQKFQALTMLYQTHNELLRFMTSHDLKIFGGYITIQLALGSWMTQQKNFTCPARFAIGIIDFAFAAIAGVLLFKAYMRRCEITALFSRLNDAFLFTKPGAYLDGVALWPEKSKFRPWAAWYIGGVVVSYIGIVVLLSSAGAPIVAP
ncbi:MAG: hypothetical protein U1F71_02985 [Verrucomicrobiaceae bacterium]